MTPSQMQSAYRENAVLGSSPERLVPVLYEHLLVNVKRGAMHMRAGDVEAKFNTLSRASDIVAELLADESPGDWPLPFRDMLLTRTLAAEVTDFILRARERLIGQQGLTARAGERADLLARLTS